MNAAKSTPHVRLDLLSLECRLTPAAAVDLTTLGSSGEIGDGLFKQYDARPTGTGKIDSFLRIQGASSKGLVQQGFNTSDRPLQFNENKSPNFTRDLRVDELPVVNVGGTNYREFLLDINQKSSQPLLSLDSLKVFVTGAAAKSAGFDVSTGKLGGADPVYDLDAHAAPENSWVKLDYRLNTGSGSGDMLFYLPDSLFTGGEYVTVYSKFGENHPSNAGFQEWAVGVGGSVVAPELGGIGGSVFYDTQSSSDQAGYGVRDDFERGVPDQIVFLDTNGNGQYDEGVELYTVTDGDGYYSFNQLMAGVGTGYTVRVAVPNLAGEYGSALFGYNQTTDDPDPIFLAPGEFKDDVNFGFYIDSSPS